MKHLLNFIVFFVLLMSFSACQHQYPAGLVEADSLLWSNPQLAFKKLNSMSSRIDTGDIEDLMYFRLLRISVKDKLYMPHYNLLEAQKMVEYYESKQDMNLLPRAYYILGRVQSDLGDVSQSLTSFHKVLDFLDDDNENLKLRSVTNAQIGEIFAKNENTRSALKFFKEAYRCDSLLNDKKGQLFDLRDIALSYDFIEKRDSARMILRQAIQRAKFQNEQNLISELAFSMANSYLEINKDSVDKYLLLSLSKSKKNNEYHLYVKSFYYQVNNENDSAVCCLHKMLKMSRGTVLKDVLQRLVLLSLEAENLDAAYNYYQNLIESSDSMFMQNKKLEEAKDMALYNYVYQVERSNYLEKTNAKKKVLLIVMVLIFVIIFFVFLFYWQMSVVKKIRLQNSFIKWKMNALNINDKQKENEQIREELRLDSLVESQKYLTNDDLQRLSSRVEQAYPNFKEHIYSCGKITEHDFHICLLVKIGVMTSKIAILLNRAPSTISTAKQRLYKKLTKEKGNAEQFDSLLEVF